MKMASTYKIFEYWRHLKGSSSMPLREELSLSSLGELVEFALILKPNPNGNYTVNVAGMALGEMVARDLIGWEFHQMFDSESRRTIGWMLDGVLEDATPVVAGLTTLTNGSRAATDFELVAMPFGPPKSFGARVLCVLQPRRQTRWKDISPLGLLTLGSFRFLHPVENGAERPAHCMAAALEEETLYTALSGRTRSRGGLSALKHGFAGPASLPLFPPAVVQAGNVATALPA